MSISIKKIKNIVHTSGYELINMRVEDITPHDLYKFKIPKLNPNPKLQKSGFYPLMHNFLRPIKMDKIVLKDFYVEDFYVDIMEFIGEHEEIFSKGGMNFLYTGFGDANYDFLKLVNKYGWLNWANEKIDLRVYDYLEDFDSKYGLEFDVLEPGKTYRTEDRLLSPTWNFIQWLIPSQEHLGVWGSLLYDLYNNTNTSEDLIKMIGLKDDEKGNKKIYPISPGANLMYFYQFKMPNYSVETCHFCEKIYIKKKRRLFCSNSCRVKSHNNKKLLNP